MGRKHRVTVATSDGLEQVIILGQGGVRMSALGLKSKLKVPVMRFAKCAQQSQTAVKYICFMKHLMMLRKA